MQSKISSNSVEGVNSGVVNQPRKRRPRTNQQQLGVLNEAYVIEPMPCAAYRETLGKQLNLSSRSIQIWFQNKRQKLKMEENKVAFEDYNTQREKALAILSKLYGLTSNLSSPNLYATNDPSSDEVEKAAQEIGVSSNTILSWYANQFLKTFLLASSDAALHRDSIASSVATSSLLEHSDLARTPQYQIQNTNSTMMLPDSCQQTPTIVYLLAADLASLSKHDIQDKIVKGSLKPVLMLNGEQQSKQQLFANRINQGNLTTLNSVSAGMPNFSATNSINPNHSKNFHPAYGQSLNTSLHRAISEEHIPSPDTLLDSAALSDHETNMSLLDENSSLYSWSQNGGESDVGDSLTHSTGLHHFSSHHGNHPYMMVNNPYHLPRVGSRENIRGIGTFRRVSSSIQLQKQLYPQVAMIPNISATSSSDTISHFGINSGSSIMPSDIKEDQRPGIDFKYQPSLFNSYLYRQNSGSSANMNLSHLESNFSTAPPSSILTSQQLKSLSLPNLFALDLQGNLDREEQQRNNLYSGLMQDGDEMEFDIEDEFLSFGRK